MVGLVPKRKYRTLTIQPFNHLAIVYFSFSLGALHTPAPLERGNINVRAHPLLFY